jgi:quercetin dioxygenase-like cupin family protein
VELIHMIEGQAKVIVDSQAYRLASGDVLQIAFS